MRISDWSSDVCSSDLRPVRSLIGADPLLRGKGKCLVEVDVLRFVMRRGGVGDVRCKQAEALRTQRQRLSMHPEQTIFQRQCVLPLKLSPSLPFLSLQAIRQNGRASCREKVCQTMKN